jgi:hypothetical protein
MVVDTNEYFDRFQKLQNGKITKQGERERREKQGVGVPVVFLAWVFYMHRVTAFVLLAVRVTRKIRYP